MENLTGAKQDFMGAAWFYLVIGPYSMIFLTNTNWPYTHIYMF